MNFGNYKKWFNNQLSPNLPERSVLVTDNAPYHSVQVDKAPSSSSKKEDMRRWLENKNIVIPEKATRVDLYELIKLYKPRFKRFAVDQISSSQNHTILRLPPYHPDFNPIELVWASMKQYVSSRNTTFLLKDVEQLCNEFFSAFSQEEWQDRCAHTVKCEEEFLKREFLIDNIIDRIIINTNDSDESDSDSSDSDLSGFEPID